MTEQQTNKFIFGPFLLDAAQRELRKEGNVVDTSVRMFDLLRVLAEHSPQPVSKQALHELLWPDTVVSDWSLSRLVSDTRQLLGDDGKDQKYIRTVKGIGFVMPEVQRDSVVSPASHPQPLRLRPGWLFLLSAAFLIITIGAYQYWSHQRLVRTVSDIATWQAHTHTAFMAQLKRRNELVGLLEQRLGVTRQEQYEKFFVRYWPQMNEQERFVCSQSRAITDTGLAENNQKIHDALNANPELFQLIEGTRELQQHLGFWLNKYRSVFVHREDMCLLYSGVEDGVPYPSGVDEAVLAWLVEESEDSATHR